MKKPSSKKKYPTESPNHSGRSPKPSWSEEGQGEPRLRQRVPDVPEPDRDPDDAPLPSRAPSGQDED